MAAVADVVAGNYDVETRLERVAVKPDASGYDVLADLTPYLLPDDSRLERDSCDDQDCLTGRIAVALTDADSLAAFGTVEPPWSSMLLRPAMRLVSLDGRGTTAWHNLGVVVPETPAIAAEEEPRVYDLDCHDLMTWLAEPTGRTVTVDAGTDIAAAIEGLFLSDPATQDVADYAPAVPRRFPRPVIAETPDERQWIIDDATTWHLVIDDLLEMAGFRPPWIDADGFLTSDLFEDPATADLPVELAVTDDADVSNLGTGATAKLDTWGVPNRWRFINTAVDDPTEGAGILTIDNLADGPTSRAGRGGRVVPRTVRVDVADQRALQEYAQRVVVQDRTPQAVRCIEVAPQPPPWHRALITVTSAGFDLTAAKHLGRSWDLPFNGEDLQVVAEAL